MPIESFTFNPFQENSYVLIDPLEQCWIIDPGCFTGEEEKMLTSFIEQNGLNPVAVVNTHCHIDHVLGNSFCKHKYDIPIYIPKGEQEVLLASKVIADTYGFPEYQYVEPDGYIEEGGIPALGMKIDILQVPGHSPGHVAFYVESSSDLIAGDVLFYQSIGRTDLPGGDYDTLIKSIQEVLYDLPVEVKVYPGHGPTTTIGFEKKYNPFCGIR